MGALTDRLTQARQDADQWANLRDPVNQHHERLATALYAAIIGAPVERISLRVDWLNVGQYQAVANYSYGTQDWYSTRGPVETTPYQAAVKLVDVLIRQYQHLPR